MRWLAHISYEDINMACQDHIAIVIQPQYQPWLEDVSVRKICKKWRDSETRIYISVDWCSDSGLSTGARSRHRHSLNTIREIYKKRLTYLLYIDLKWVHYAVPIKLSKRYLVRNWMKINPIMTGSANDNAKDKSLSNHESLNVGVQIK